MDIFIFFALPGLNRWYVHVSILCMFSKHWNWLES